VAWTWARRALAGVAGLAAALLAVAWLLPRQPVVSRSIEVAARPAAIFPLVGDLRRSSEWQPWFGRDPRMVVTFTGPVDGVGQTMVWEGDPATVGSGRQSIVRLEPDREVETALDVAGRGAATVSITLAADDGTTAVTWRLRTDLGFNPVARYVGLRLDRMVGPDFESGLAKLKALAEAPPAAGQAGAPVY
jgi:hypothetical protein